MSIDTQVRDEVTGLVDGLKVFQGNVLSTRQFHQVLDAVDHAKGSVGIPLTNVTGPEPPIRSEDSGILVEVRTFVVALDDRRTTEANLSLGWLATGGIPGLGNVNQLDLETRNGDSNVSIGHFLRWKDGTHSTGFGKSITLEDGKDGQV